jgi:hypothetical protein
MPSLRTIVSELELALGRNTISDKPSVPWLKLIEQVKNKRASEIQRQFSKNETVYPQWISSMGLILMEAISNEFDPEYPLLTNGRKVAKYPLPATVSLINNPILGDHGVNMVASADGRCLYNYCPMDQFEERIKLGEIYLHSEGIYTLTGNTLLAYPYKTLLNVKLILFDPLEGYIIDTRFKNSGELVIVDDYNEALEYEVYSGQIVHDGVTYNAGETFTAVETTFTGGGKVRLKNLKRKLNEDDLYPVSPELKDIIIKRIIGEDYGLELQLPADNKLDGKNKTQIVDDLDRVKAD